jgi:GcrA cell cycle regulator
MRRDPWTAEKTQQLASLLAQGKSFREIAETFGTTRNAIIGKVQRERIKRGHDPEPRKRVLSVSPPKPAPATLPEPKRGPAVGLLDVTGCKWPVAEDASLIGGQAFCNHAKADNQPYCPYHVQASIAPYSAELKRRTFKMLSFVLKRAA